MQGSNLLVIVSIISINLIGACDSEKMVNQRDSSRKLDAIATGPSEPAFSCDGLRLDDCTVINNVEPTIEERVIPEVGIALVVMDGFASCPIKPNFKKEDMKLFSPVLSAAIEAVIAKHKIQPEWLISCKSANASADKFFVVTSESPNAVALEKPVSSALADFYQYARAKKLSTYMYGFSQGGGDLLAHAASFVSSDADELFLTTADPIDSKSCNTVTITQALLNNPVILPMGCSSAPELSNELKEVLSKAGRFIRNYYIEDADLLLHSGRLVGLGADRMANMDVTVAAKNLATSTTLTLESIVIDIFPFTETQKLGIKTHVAVRHLPIVVENFLKYFE